MRVALFATCLIDALFPDAGKATVTILERLGLHPEFPLEQTCCGQMHANSGYFEPNLVRRYVDTFDEFDAIVTPSASCAGAIRHQHVMIARDAGDNALATRAQATADKTYELSQFLVDVMHTDDVGAYFPHRVTYHPTCHSLRVTRVGDAPLRLLRDVQGLELVELPGAHECCGFGGTFAVKNAETSTAMVADKCRAIVSTGAQVCTAVDGSCLLQIGGRLERENAQIRALLLAEILASEPR